MSGCAIIRCVKPQQPSRTALAAAASRAAHLIVDDEPPIFADPLAQTLLGGLADKIIERHRAHGTHIALWGTRALSTARSRYTEDRLAEAVGRGITQYVILGAGLDSFAYRSEMAGQIRVFEVDHPATQEWKRRRLAEAEIGVPGTVTFAPVDFEADSLADRLAASGFQPAEPALVSWLGVTMYLTGAALDATLGQIGGFAPGTELVANYMLPAGLQDETARSYSDIVMPLAAQRGEPWLTLLTPDDMTAMLERHGFGEVRHVSQRDAVAPGLWQRTGPPRPLNLSNLAHATVT
jgi:methyltransferase (TIGR00027 family)